MKRFAFAAAILAVALSAGAQQPNPLDVVPDKMPNDIPYGPAIPYERAQQALNAAIAESTKRGWKLNIAVVDSGANLEATTERANQLRNQTAQESGAVVDTPRHYEIIARALTMAGKAG